MTEKNKKKLDAKKRRNLWTINPRTRFKGNDKAYNRQRDKKRKERDFEWFGIWYGIYICSLCVPLQVLVVCGFLEKIYQKYLTFNQFYGII